MRLQLQNPIPAPNPLSHVSLEEIPGSTMQEHQRRSRTNLYCVDIVIFSNFHHLLLVFHVCIFISKTNLIVKRSTFQHLSFKVVQVIRGRRFPTPRPWSEPTSFCNQCRHVLFVFFPTV